LADRPRRVDDPMAPDTGDGTAPLVDIGAFERQVLCDIPVFLAQPASATACVGDVVEFVVGVVSGGVVEYQWIHDDVEIPGAIDDTLIVDVSGRSSFGTYRVVVSHPWGEVSSDSAQLIEAADCDADFIRGDANGDGSIEISDAVALLSHIFLGVDAPCVAALDIDDDDRVVITDAAVLISYLVTGGSPPAPPFPGCGVDPSGGRLTCDESPTCP
ncbi:MAG: hypothetical protein KDC38_17075, partial [Planctomycetes bacterium]|nr:hypothetical protein [Planctomycetota bacterium]